MELVLNVKLSELVEGCKKRNPQAQKELFKAFYGRMFAVCLRYSPTNDDAQDWVQDGFIKLFEKIDLYNGQGSFEGWLRRMFVNMCLDKIRKSKNSVLKYSAEFNDENSFVETEEVELDFKLIDIIGQDKILEEIQNLSPMYRTVFSLFVLEGYSHQEISEELGISEGTSKSNLSKAKGNLRKAFESILKAKHAS